MDSVLASLHIKDTTHYQRKLVTFLLDVSKSLTIKWKLGHSVTVVENTLSVYGGNTQ